MKITQNSTPLLDVLLNHAKNKVTSFHTPGHKNGASILPKLRDFTKRNVYYLDVTVFPEVDSLHDPVSCIKLAQELMAKAYNVKNSFFLVNGSTVGNIAMLLSACDPGDSVILSRTCHKSVLAGIILAGVWPIWAKPVVDQQRDIIYEISSKEVEEYINNYPEAKAVFITSPNYNGICPDLIKIQEVCKKHNKILLVDEAHGPHLKFHPDLPVSAVEVGADMCVHSVHKVLSALSQASVLHFNSSKIDINRVKRVVSMLQTTSPNYFILASIDAARMQVVKNGTKVFSKIISYCEKAREEINKLPNIFALTRKEIKSEYYDLDLTKLTINVTKTGLTGYKIEEILAKEYKIQVDCADMFNLVAISGFGTSKEDVEKLVYAITDISKKYSGDYEIQKLQIPPLSTEVVMLPRDAFFSTNTKRVSLKKSVGYISAQTLTPYPPGLPILTPGERITKDTVDYLQEISSYAVRISGQESENLKTIKVIR
ncbi:MAG: aminotransferase class I/II-fold pyridoxal phosphate-dependent enzyme [Elusimicrobiota bacterium]|nr:aminotransferase class I/II-fold pyridoxal phosphate-dependent enzyme [Endomicrobiia bacterium]MDW8164929.1 aminotransferase class I/II-fold pyridoxal phosphate-dependent enzyme [Elusimicrobiota bacterium]